MPSTIYIIALMDNGSDNYIYGVLDQEKNRAFTSLAEAKAALAKVVEDDYVEFLPTAYGKAYPYDTTTFEELLEKEEFAPWGWGIEEGEDGPQRVCIGLLAFTVQ